MIPRVEIEEFQLGELRWRVIIHRATMRTLWERYATQEEAFTGKREAEVYLRQEIVETKTHPIDHLP